jgi:hypothetical protein
MHNGLGSCSVLVRVFETSRLCFGTMRRRPCCESVNESKDAREKADISVIFAQYSGEQETHDDLYINIATKYREDFMSS